MFTGIRRMGRGSGRTIHRIELEPSDRAWSKPTDNQPHERRGRLVNQTNHTALIEASHATRFGPNWPGKRCLAKTRRGTPCQNPAIRGRNRCKLHGGRSTGPKTEAGKARVVAAHWKHGRRSRAHVARVKEINAELRRAVLECKRAGLLP